MYPAGHPYDHELDRVEGALEEALKLVRDTRRDRVSAAQWMEITSRLGGLVAEMRDASSEVRQTLLGGARTAVLLYLRGHVGQAVPPHALEGVSGIREWARRIRELRALGWDIECLGSGPTAQYRLVADHLDAELAQSDQMVAAITGSRPKERIIEYLLHLCPWAASALQLERVSGVPTWRQEIRGLIDEGWLIQSHETNSELAPGSYRLAKIEEYS